MIDYDSHQWSSHLFNVRGSMVREITGRVSVCVAFSAVVVLAQRFGASVAISPTTHTLVGVALGLLMVFRTNASYDRYWEGRRQWGTLVNASRNLARAARSYIAPAAPDLAERLGVWTSVFAYTVMHALRDGNGLGPPGDRLLADESAAALKAPHVPLAVAVEVSRCLAEARDRGVISDPVMRMIDRHVAELIDALGACERIHKTPVPFVYVVHLRRALIAYCFTLPFALIDLYGSWTVLMTLGIAYTFFGIEEIGVEIEDPFGHDANDLPLDDFCRTIERDVLGTTAASAPSTTPLGASN